MKKYIKYLMPSIITLTILSVIFYVNNLYPFGIHSIVKVDADYQYIPVLYKIYDLLHGHGSIFYSDIGFGNNIFISLIIQGSLFSPVNLLLYFTSRSNIINYYNIIIIVKLCLISLTCYIYLNNKFKVNNFYKILGSVIYTFSGFVILNFFNLMWLDCIILFPLIMMYLDKLLDKGNYIGYIITLSLSLIITYYISYYILVFIVFYSYINIFLGIKDKNIIKNKCSRLGVSTVIALLISSFSTIPSIYQTIISSRFSSGGFYVLLGNVMSKSLHILFSPLFIVLSILYISKYKDNKLEVYKFILLLVLYTIGIVVEPINLLMHAGSYWDFPFRYGFITTFILMIGSFKYLEKCNVVKNKKNDVIKALLFPSFALLVIYFNNKYLDVIIDSQIVLSFDNVDIYCKIILIILLVFLMYIISLSFNSNNLRCFSLGVTCLLSLYVFCGFTMYYESGYFLTIHANDINNNMDILHDGRYKIDYTVYSPDYGFVLNVDTLDNWLHVIPDGEVDIYKKLGYETSDTCIRSYGGTILTDWLFNVKYLISNKIKDNELYELLDEYDNKYLYKIKYNSNYGIMFNNKINIDNLYDSFDIQNEIYKNLFNSNNNIIKVDNYDELDNINYKINSRGILYLDTDYYEDISYVKINDEYIYDFDNYIKELGIYDKDINIHIELKESTDNYRNIKLGFIKIDDILKINSYDIKYDNGVYYINNKDNYKYLFLPINNINGLKVYLNNNLVNSDKYLNNFVMIKLNNGDNYVKLKYDMPYFNLGVILSIIGIILLVLYKYILSNKYIDNISYYIFMILVIVMFLYYYFYSMIKYFINS